MTKEECIAKYHHQVWGMMLDASRFSGTGSARSILEDQLMGKLDAVIAAIWKECQPPAPQANGAPVQARKVNAPA